MKRITTHQLTFTGRKSCKPLSRSPMRGSCTSPTRAWSRQLTQLIRANHKVIVSLIAAAGAQHLYLPTADILGILPETDLLIADVSSVTLDHLYLAPDSPIVLTDRRSDSNQLHADSPVSAACAVIDQSSITEINNLIITSLDTDAHRSDRERMRSYYFSDTEQESSTGAFWAAITTEIAAHDAALQGIQRVRQVGS